MAPIKRKPGPTNESFARQHKKFADSDDRPSKRARQEDGPKNSSKIDQSAKTTAPKSQSTVRIERQKDEDVAFPRGGASVLTPLEHKQIQLEATRDVLFEQQQDSKGGDLYNSENGGASKADPKSKKRKSKSKEQRTSDKLPIEDTVRIESLSYKRLVAGSQVLGQVTQINDHDVAVALPNNLVGYVPITAISDKLTERVECLLADDGSDSGDDSSDIDLNDIFEIGQYVRAYVTSVTDGSSGSASGAAAKRRIELSLRPQHANHGVTKSELVPFTTVMASVASIEDHGMIMDMGLEDGTIRGFMSSKELGYGKDASKVQEGAVYLCMITGLNSNGKIVKLSADIEKLGNIKKTHYLADAPTIDAFLPGTAIEVLVSEVGSKGVSGKVMGSLDVTADLIHSGAGVSSKDIENLFKVGSKVKGRIIFTLPTSDDRKLGVSFLSHVISLSTTKVSKDGKDADPLSAVPLSTIVDKLVVRKVEEDAGLFVDVGVKSVLGFVHISRIQDGEKVEKLSQNLGPYKVGSEHRGRVIGYNSLDGLYIISLEQSVLDQAFLRLEDLQVGSIVKGTVERLVINEAGIGGVLVNLAKGISGLVAPAHMADVALQHPERKFREGMTVTARVLSTNPSKRQIRLTLKKTLVNAEAAPFKSYADINPGMQSPGTIVNIIHAGAVVQFYGDVRGFLPVSEMSEAFIKDPREHFKDGQVVNVHVLSVDPENEKMTVSCKDPSLFNADQKKSFSDLKIGQIVSAKVTEKTDDVISVVIEGLELRAILPLGHLTDGSEKKNSAQEKKIRVGQTLTDIVVINKFESRRAITLTNKPSLLKAAKDGSLIKNFSDVSQNKTALGFVKKITVTAVIVQFGGGITGLLPKAQLPREVWDLPDFGYKSLQSISVVISVVNHEQQNCLLSLPGQKQSQAGKEGNAAVNPVDPTITSVDDYTLGKTTKAIITAVKDTQLNVKLADNVQGRVDMSQIFDSFDNIKDWKYPLREFSKDQTINVRVMGMHDARSHRFLPISHRGAKHLVFELSAKPSDQKSGGLDILSLEAIEVGSSWTGFVNNVQDSNLWVNLSPNVRGYIRALDLSNDVSALKDLEKSYPVGAALKVKVVDVDPTSNRLTLAANQASEHLTIESLTKGSVMPGKVIKVMDHQLVVQLNDTLAGVVHLTDMSDDYDQADPWAFSKNKIIRVCVVNVDRSNKKVRLSTRTSRTLNSSASVEDPEISSISQLKVNDVVRGFIQSVTDKGLFVNLGGDVVGFVRVSELSDSYIKEWKSQYEIDQLVKGKIIAADPAQRRLHLSLKTSVIEKEYKPPLTFLDMKVGKIVTGKVNKVENFGVFIRVDGSDNVSGLCHRNDMADSRVNNVQELYEEGDAVKAIVLKVDKEKRRLAFGLKASFFDDNSDEDMEEIDSEDDLDEMEGLDISADSDDEDLSEGGVEIEEESDGSEADDGNADQMQLDEEQDVPALNAGGFDWTASALDEVEGNKSDEEDDGAAKKKKKKKAEIKVDRTGDLDVNGPQTSSDFERLLLGSPDSSQLWIQYIAFQMKLGELLKAREVAERAIRTINMREETEKLNVWVAFLNLEVAYGTEETVEDVFKRACQYNDAQEVHERLTSIYIQSGKNEKADEIFQSLVKKFSQDPSVWYNYAHFLHNSLSAPDRARALLQRATQSLPGHAHLPLTIKFAALEFHSPSGSAERGRTIFEGVLATYPRRLDLWNQLLDLEIQQGDKDLIRSLFDRVARRKDLKPRGAKAWFKRWSEWEAKNGDAKSQARVRKIAQEWVLEAESKKGKKTVQDEDE